MASLPKFGFGGFMQDGIAVSCTFDYEDTSPKNIAYVCVISLLGFVGELYFVYFRFITHHN